VEKLSLEKREARVRRIGRREGYTIRKSRGDHVSSDNLGAYMVVNQNNACVFGHDFAASLRQVEIYFGLGEHKFVHPGRHGSNYTA
jgi:hypothetical protein